MTPRWRKDDGLTVDSGSRDALAACLALFVMGCSAPADPSIGDDAEPLPQGVTATPELAAVTQQAVERWSEATGRDWVYLGASPDDQGADFHVQLGQPPERYVAFAYGNGRIVVGPEWVETPELASILMHELGHAFRGDHHSGRGVMYYGLGDGVMTPCLTPADLQWACQDYDCASYQAECDMPEAPVRASALHGLLGCPHDALRARTTPRGRAAD